MAKIENSTMFGGKPYPNWQEEDFLLPGYQNARIVFKNIREPNTMWTWGFMISPHSLSVVHSSDIQQTKTMAGWFLSRGGPSMGQLSISGYFLDTLRAPERLKFIESYMEYGQDNQNEFMEFVSDYSQEIIIEGTKYLGLIANISTSKSANQQFMYQYNITFMFYKMQKAYSYGTKSMTTHEMRIQSGIFSKRDQITEKDHVTDVAATAQMAKGVIDILQRKTL